MSAVRAPRLVLAVGNPGRGDDALGPMLASRLEAVAASGVEVVTEYQLQIENALDLADREEVIFVDSGAGTKSPFEVRAIAPAGNFRHTSHALEPAAVLATYAQVMGEPPPPAVLLCVRGESFELGDALTPTARANLEAAWCWLREAVASQAEGRDRRED
jgi:hydrogenase maturation protease